MSRFDACAVVALAMAACGGGSRAAAPDAGIDAAPAGPPVTGLGQPCALANNSADCPTNLACLPFASNKTTGYCSTVCVFGAEMMTDQAAMIASISPDPQANLTICQQAFAAPIGVASCTVLVQWTPMDVPFKPSSTYEQVAVACSISCDPVTNACPGALKCQLAQGLCVP